MTEDLHDLTKFLLDRLKTYPEEFHFTDTGLTSGKWRTALRAITFYGAAEDKAAFDLAGMDYALQASLKTLLAPEYSADDLVGQSSNGSGVQSNPGGQFGVSGGASMTGGPTLSQQQFQSAIAQQQSMYQQQDVDAQVRALGFPLKPISPLGTPTTVLGTTYGQLKKRLGL